MALPRWAGDRYEGQGEGESNASVLCRPFLPVPSLPQKHTKALLPTTAPPLRNFPSSSSSAPEWDGGSRKVKTKEARSGVQIAVVSIVGGF